ncbi:MAG: hypothetical protein ACLQBB_03265 [Solirubrobacteraceae bacterium]
MSEPGSWVRPIRSGVACLILLAVVSGCGQTNLAGLKSEQRKCAEEQAKAKKNPNVLGVLCLYKTPRGRGSDGG